MEQDAVVDALSALAHPGRLRVFRLLVVAGDAGMAAGDIARAAEILPNTLSTNLNILSHAGLVTSQRDGRSIIYRAAYDRMADLLLFLTEDCCGGNAAVCAPLAQVANRAAACNAC